METLLTLTVLALLLSNAILLIACHLLRHSLREYRVTVRCLEETEKLQNQTLEHLVASLRIDDPDPDAPPLQ